MRKILASLIVLAFIVGGGIKVAAQKISLIRDYEYSSYESITVADTAIGFTSGTITPTTGEFANKPALEAFCRLETAQVRFRMDGTDPTASEGTPLMTGEVFTLRSRGNIIRFRAIRTDAQSATLKCHYGWK